MEKWFEKTIEDVAKHNEYPKDVRTVEQCNKLDMWTPVDLIIREYLNNGGGSAKGFLGISTSCCIRAYNYARQIREELIEKHLVSEYAKNNWGFELWNHYNY